jgi:DNA-binding Xre family transcriptional regulator
MAKLKNNLRELLRRKYGIKEPARLPSQEQIAKDLGIAQSSLSMWLNGKVTRYDEDMLMKLCKALDCTVGDLLYIEYAPGEREHA